MADPIVNFFKSQLVGTYSNTDTSITISTGDGALLPDPATDGAFNLTLFKGQQVNENTVFEIVRVTARSGDVLTVTREQEGTTAITVDSEVHSILMSATKKTFDDINTAIDSIELADQTLNTTDSVIFKDVRSGIFKNPQTISTDHTITGTENAFVMGDIDVTGTITIQNGGKLVIL